MAIDWKSQITDQDEVKVFEALGDPTWDFRTISGLCKATGLEEKKIQGILDKHPSLIRKSIIPDKNGRELYTLSARKESMREFIQMTKSFITKSTD